MRLPLLRQAVMLVLLLSAPSSGSEDCWTHLEEAGWNAAYDPEQIPECAFSACNGEGGGDDDCCAASESAGCALGNVYLSEAACYSWEEGGTERCALRVCCSTANEPPAGFTRHLFLVILSLART